MKLIQCKDFTEYKTSDAQRVRQVLILQMLKMRLEKLRNDKGYVDKIQLEVEILTIRDFLKELQKVQAVNVTMSLTEAEMITLNRINGKYPLAN